MAIKETCDFCGKEIKYHITINKQEAVGTVEIKEKKCDVCTATSVNNSWPEQLIVANKAWETKQAEIKNFHKQQLRKLKEKFYLQKAMEHYGSFYTAEIEQEILENIDV